MASRKTSTRTFNEAQLAVFPELRHFVDGQAPAEELRAYFRFQRGWPTLVTVVLALLLAPPLVLLLHRGLGLGIALTVAVAVGLQLVISWTLLGLVFPALRRRRIREALRRRLRAAGIRPCAACAYDLRGSPGRCPECGARNETSVETDPGDAS